MGIAYNTSVVRDGLVLYLDAANPKSYPGTGTTWTGLGTTGNNGTLLNGVGFNNEGGGVLVFDGIDDHVDTGQKFNFNQSDKFTVSFWINFLDHSDKATAAAGILGKGHFYSNTWDIFLRNSNSITFEVSGNPTRLGITGLNTGPLALSTWHYYTATYNDGVKIIYVNGKQLGTQTYSKQGNFNNTNNVLIARRFGDGSRSLRGKLGIVKAYSKALTEQEIKQNFEATRGRYGI